MRQQFCILLMVQLVILHYIVAKNVFWEKVLVI
jgi:hypothetical protein